jgi:pyruvate/2-oxoglutarate/acetoin dehydrogenase E1 component
MNARGSPGSTLVRAINRALAEEMERDEKVLVIGLDVGRQGGIFSATRGLHARFGSTRVLDMPISEAGYTGAAIGLAIEGFRPIVEIQFADFVTVAFDQIATVAAKIFYLTAGRLHVPLVVRLPYGANLAGQGYMTAAGPHHSQSLEAWFCHLAGVRVVMPSTPADALGLLKSAIRDDNPVLFFEPKALYFERGDSLPPAGHLVPLGQAVIRRAGDDATIIATGATVAPATAVANRLAAEGISIEVIDPRTLVPLDRATIIGSVTRTGRAVIVHEAPRTGGYGGEIAAILAEEAFASLRAPIIRVCGRDMPVPNGLAARASLPGEARIEAALRRVLNA